MIEKHGILTGQYAKSWTCGHKKTPAMLDNDISQLCNFILETDRKVNEKTPGIALKDFRKNHTSMLIRLFHK